MEDEDRAEVRDSMKCLKRMFSRENKGVISFKTCLSFHNSDIWMSRRFGCLSISSKFYQPT